MRRGLSLVLFGLATCAFALSAPGVELAFAKTEKQAPKLGPGERIHEVAKGQSLGRIAKRYHVTVRDIRERNHIEKGGRKIQPGDKLVIPAAPGDRPPKKGDANPKEKPQPSKEKPQPSKEKPQPSKAKPQRRGNVRCPSDMASIFGRYCVDRYEAYIAIMLPKGKLKRHSPFEPVGTEKNIKALNRQGRVPQAHISRDQAELACQNAGKRLCTDDEWITACKGKKPTTWPYGEEQKPGRCNDTGFSAFQKLFGPGDGGPAPQSAYTWENLNDSRLNTFSRTLAKSGSHTGCRNSFKLYDMVGNLHEWTSAPGGTFRGGYYLDVKQHGPGCTYKTTAHNTKYHDYSTGFRCCKG